MGILAWVRALFQKMDDETKYSLFGENIKKFGEHLNEM